MTIPNSQPEPQRNPKAEAKAAKAYYKASRPWWKKKRFIIPVALLVLIIAVSAGNSGGNDSTKKQIASAGKSASPTHDATPTDDNTPTVSVEDKKWAKYQQLRDSRGITGDSVIGDSQDDYANVCDKPMKPVAKIIAKNLSYDDQQMARKDVLAFVKAFCPKQTDGWKSTFSDVLFTKEQTNAIGSAQEYLDTQAYSKQGLIEQLSSDYGEGYPHDVAVFAVEHIKVNWNKQAVKSAKEYLSSQHYSRQGLLEQLESSYGEGFTHEQATYGVDHGY